ncbi:MAG TPA: hypothetical protein VFB99_17720 [Vicinamibacterales bacterium]|nr:hypothetical protein [Vicinamibacterales bacterium]
MDIIFPFDDVDVKSIKQLRATINELGLTYQLQDGHEPNAIGRNQILRASVLRADGSELSRNEQTVVRQAMDGLVEYRAYDLTTAWMGVTRLSVTAAQGDAESHNDGCAKHGGYGRAIVVQRNPEAPGRCIDLDGRDVWPPHGRSTGAVRWR